jgi:penicillin-binding protein 2
MAGKTGTAQVKGKADTSLFVAFGPVSPGVAPEYAVSVVIPEAGFGSEVSAPLAFRIMKPVSEGALPETITDRDRKWRDERFAKLVAQASGGSDGAGSATTTTTPTTTSEAPR